MFTYIQRALDARREGREQGFTLIELLIVIIIIGILAAIAIPIFLNQREKAWKKAATSDTRNMAVQVESFFDDNGTYPATEAAAGLTVRESDNVTVTLFGDADSYCINANHANLTANGVDFILSSSVGKVQEVGVGGVAACANANS